MKLFEDIFGHALQRRKQQWRLQHIQAELEQCQQDCANLGAHIGWLIQRKTELETEINRREA
jgi:hypothetical protein